MINYINFKEEYEKQVVVLWNKCLFFDKLDINKFRQKAILDDNFDSNLAFLALDQDKVVGFIYGTKRIFPYMERGLEEKRGWINVMFVDPEYRRQGIGTNLYGKVEEVLKEKGVEEITLAAYSPSYFFGGVDEENYPESKYFFKKLGYIVKEEHYSMGRSLVDFTMSIDIQNKKKLLEAKGYKFAKFTNDKSLELLNFLKDEFGGGWKRNGLNLMRDNKAEELIILVLDSNNKICGFSMSAIDNDLERFGPIGVSSKLRNEGIGSVLLNYSFEAMKDRGIKRMYFYTTDEAGRRYYERNGLTLIRTTKNYRKTI